MPTERMLSITDDMILRYCKELSDVITSISHKVKVKTGPVKDIQCHPLKPGDWVFIKKHTRKSFHEPRWKGPFQVILTNTAVKCATVPQWIHAAHVKKTNPPCTEEETVSRTVSPSKSLRLLDSGAIRIVDPE